MKISTKGRYALRVMIDLAEQNSDEYIPLKAIAKRQEISEKYLESIIVVLSKAGFVDGMRGKGGGYKLTRPAEGYTVGSILRLIEGPLVPVSCLECKPVTCSRAAQCRTLPLWSKLDQGVNDYLDSVTVADLIRTEDGGDYVI